MYDVKIPGAIHPFNSHPSACRAVFITLLVPSSLLSASGLTREGVGRGNGGGVGGGSYGAVTVICAHTGAVTFT